MSGIVVDACPVIFLAKLDQLALIRRVFPGSILTPASVRQELSQSTIPADEQARIGEFLKHGRIVSVRGAHFASQALSLTDRHVLSLARKQPKALILTDDSLVRRIARAEGLPVAGTLGVMIRAVRAKIMTQREALQAIDELVSHHRLRISVELYQEAMRQIRVSS